MNIYFSGIGGVGIGPLAEISIDAGNTVLGSDSTPSLTTRELEKRGVSISYDQNGDFLRTSHDQTPIDWFVHTAALPADHPELLAAKSLGIHTAKRDEIISEIITEKGLKLIAISGTHGKTTTTGMMVWILQQLGIPVSYSVGSTLSWGPAGQYHPDSQYFVYECDEFDRNFLHFSPYLSLITSVDYDHPDTYPTTASYMEAFSEFALKSQQVIAWHHDVKQLQLPENSWLLNDNEVADVTLPGLHNRQNASLVLKAVEYLGLDTEKARQDFSHFPGTNRRFEKIADNLYSDYGHHPVEIAATLQLAREISEQVVLVYQPHQNIRQHEIKGQYSDQFELAEKIYWLPTYLSRENPDLEILSPEQLYSGLTNRQAVESAQLDDKLWQNIAAARNAGKLVVCMGAGSIDAWLRQNVSSEV